MLSTHVKKIKGTAHKNGDFYFRIRFFPDGCEQAVSWTYVEEIGSDVERLETHDAVLQ